MKTGSTSTGRKQVATPTGMIAALSLILLRGSCLAGNTPESAFDKDPWPLAKEGPVKVFLLCGQSNMQGHAALRTLEYLIYNVGSERGYHYLGSARIMYRMGKAFAEGMIPLLDD